MATTITVKRGDTARKIADTLKIDGVAVNLTGTTIKLVFKRDLDEAGVARDATIVSAVAGTVEYQLVTDDTDVAGTFFLEWHVAGFPGGALRFPTDGYNKMIVQEDLPEI